MRRGVWALSVLAGWAAGCHSAGVQGGRPAGTGNAIGADGGGGSAGSSVLTMVDGGTQVPAVSFRACGYYGLGFVSTAVLSADEKTLAIAALDFVGIVDVATQTMLRQLPSPGYNQYLAFSPDGAYVAAGAFDNVSKDIWRIWRVADGAQIAASQTVAGGVHVAFSPDGTQFLVLVNGTLSAHAFPSLTPQWTASVADRVVYAPDGSFIVTASGQFIDPRSGQTTGQLGTASTGSFGYGIAVSGNGLVATGGALNNGPIDVWRVSDGSLVLSIPNHDDIEGLALSRDGSRLAAAAVNFGTSVWEVASGALVASGLPAGNIFDLAFTAAGDLLTTTADPVVRLIDLHGATPGATDVWDYSWGHARDYDIEIATPSPDGTLIATATGVDHQVLLWNVAQSSLAGTITTPDNAASLAFSPDSNTLYIGDGTSIDAWRVSDQTLIAQTKRAHTATVSVLAVSPDGTLLASVSPYDSMKIWRLSDMTTLVTMPLHGTGNKIAFSSDGTRLGMGLSTGPGVVRVSDAQILCEAATTAVPAVNARIFFSQDGTQLFGAGPNGVEELSAADCSLVRDLPAATNKSFYTFALSPSQRQLVTSDLGYGMELWDLATGALTGSALFDGVALPTIGLSFMPGDATRLVVTDRAAARMYCRSASDGWHID